MAATLLGTRDELRDEIKRLLATVANANEWVEALERDRPSDATAYDTARLAQANELLVQLRAETSTTSTAGLNLRVKNTIGLV